MTCIKMVIGHLGHIDIEYEWFLEGVEEKKIVKYKYIGEGDIVENLEDEKYKQEICTILK